MSQCKILYSVQFSSHQFTVLCLSFAAWTGKQENNASASELEDKEGYATQDLQGASVVIAFFILPSHSVTVCHCKCSGPREKWGQGGAVSAMISWHPGGMSLMVCQTRQSVAIYLRMNFRLQFVFLFCARPLAGCVANATGGTEFGQCRMKWY